MQIFRIFEKIYNPRVGVITNNWIMVLQCVLYGYYEDVDGLMRGTSLDYIMVVLRAQWLINKGIMKHNLLFMSEHYEAQFA